MWITIHKNDPLNDEHFVLLWRYPDRSGQYCDRQVNPCARISEYYVYKTKREAIQAIREKFPKIKPANDHYYSGKAWCYKSVGSI